MSHRFSSSRSTLIAGGYGFLLGIVFCVAVALRFPQWLPERPTPEASRVNTSSEPQPAPADPAKPAPAPTPALATSSTPDASASAIPLPQDVPTQAPPTLSADFLTDLRDRHLTIPVQGVARSELRDSFFDQRVGEGQHNAIDIMAPRNTPVVAVEDGTIVKLFLSKAGGVTIYQFDPRSTFVYYYAHLERYAPNVAEGMHVARGEVLGYVGSSGNASPEAPHLHFEIGQLSDKKQWWKSTPINPYTILK